MSRYTRLFDLSCPRNYEIFSKYQLKINIFLVCIFDPRCLPLIIDRASIRFEELNISRGLFILIRISGLLTLDLDFRLMKVDFLILARSAIGLII